MLYVLGPFFFVSVNTTQGERDLLHALAVERSEVP